jgi:3-isopropylmalate/(R)-2-methylmalate dehydratase small subunit
MGRVFKFGDNIDTDMIIPGKYLSLSTQKELAAVCMEGYRKGFIDQVKKGDLFVAGKNFGCGSSREHAPLSIKAAGVGCIIAESFARIFFRNAINIGLVILESPEAANGLDDGDECAVDIKKGLIRNLTKQEEYTFRPFPEELQIIIDMDGMVNYVRSEMRKNSGH